MSAGLGQGEVLGLCWSDLDRGNYGLQVQRRLQRAKGNGLGFVQPKSAAGCREVIQGEQTIQQLHEHRALLQEERRQAADDWQENGLMFPSSIDTR